MDVCPGPVRSPAAVAAAWLALLAVLATAGPARSQPEPTAAGVRDVCVAQHEQAQVLRLEAKLLAARQALRRCARPECPGAIQTDCVRWLDELRPNIPSVVLNAQSDAGDESDVDVYANGDRLVEELDGRPIELDPGAYSFRFELPGADPVEVRIVLRAGEHNRPVSADFRTPAEPPPTAPSAPPPAPAPPSLPLERYRPVPLATYLLGGVAIGAAGSAVYFGLSAQADHSDAERECAPLCSDSRVAGIERAALAADVLTGVAIVSAGAAVIMYLVEPERTRPAQTSARHDHRPRVDAVATTSGAYVQMRGWF